MLNILHSPHREVSQRMKKKPTNYIDNKQFEALVTDYCLSSTAVSAVLLIEQELFGLFDLLIHNIFKSFNFSVSFEDSKQDCFVLLLKTLRNFNPSKGKAFNYFTTIILNNLRLLYTKNQKHYSRLEELIDPNSENLNE